jgi:hypothetical protein
MVKNKWQKRKKNAIKRRVNPGDALWHLPSPNFYQEGVPLKSFIWRAVVNLQKMFVDYIISSSEVINIPRSVLFAQTIHFKVSS